MTFNRGILDINELYQSFFKDSDDKAIERAENRFMELARKINPEITDKELSEILSDGSYDNNGREVIISWPEIK